MIEEDHRFYVLDASEVPDSYQTAAEAALIVAAADVGIEPPSIRYFQPTRPGEREEEKALARAHGLSDVWESFTSPHDPLGCADHALRTVFVRVGLESEQLKEAIGHEAKHLAQGPAIDSGMIERYEREAKSYGLRFAQDYLDERDEAVARRKALAQARRRGLLQQMWG